MIPRVHLPGPHAVGEIADAGADASHRLARVLRLREGDPVQVFDGEGARFAATVARADPRALRLRIEAAEPPMPESPLRITLAQCVSSSEKMDWTVEKAVELGVASIVPLVSARCVARLDDERGRRRLDHWRRLVVAACAQCGRDRLPPVAAPQPLQSWLAAPRAPALRIVLEPGSGARLACVGQPAAPVTLLVGPESGLTAGEVDAARAAGFEAFSVGPRVLRTETAGLAAIAALQARFGDL